MIRRLLSAAALVGALATSARTIAKPPDLPLNETIVVKPQAVPILGISSASPCKRLRAHPLLDPKQIEMITNQSNDGSWIFLGVNSNSGLTGSIVLNERNFDCVPSNVVQCVAEEEMPPAATVYDILPAALPAPAVYQLRPTARRTLTGSILLGVNPLLALLPTDKALDSPCDHPQKVAGDDVLQDVPAPDCENKDRSRGFYFVGTDKEQEGNWFGWLISHFTARHAAPTPERNEGYINAFVPGNFIAGLTPAGTLTSDLNSPIEPQGEALAMPQEDAAPVGMTCPFLVQQAADRHACQLEDAQIGRDVLDNLESLMAAKNLMEMAEEFARDGCVGEAMDCCAIAQSMCPGSACADQAAGVMLDLYVRLCLPASGAEEVAEESQDKPPAQLSKCESFWEALGHTIGWPINIYSSDPNRIIIKILKDGIQASETPHSSKTELGIEKQVSGLMKACRLLMSEGLHEQAAELARQAFALDPERVMADPLIYKMHLLAGKSSTTAGSSKSSEPPSCPYCPSAGKPIQGIVPDKKKIEDGPTTLLVPPMPSIDYEVVSALDRVLTETATGAEEASEGDAPSSLAELVETMMGGCGQVAFGVGADGLGMSGEYVFGGSVYHVRYSRGCLAIWKTPDAAKAKP